MSLLRVAILNRGEAAARFLNTAAEYTSTGGVRLRSIAVYTDVDRDAAFVRHADEAVALGPVMVPDARTGRSRHAYLDYERVERALDACRADAVWVGWGFLAEDPEFAELCDRRGLVYIGPPAPCIRSMANKITAKQIAERAQVPVIAWSGGPVTSVEDARRAGEHVGYPLVVKAAAGGGGRGIRLVARPADLETAFESASREAGLAFADATVFLERKMSGCRHVEVQVLGDAHGTLLTVGVRDCTVQRRHQKVLEESASPSLSREAEAGLRESSRSIASAVSYQSAGTVEFLYDPRSDQHLFMEMNTRLQVEHPVTEMTTGLDIVRQQIDVALGERLQPRQPAAMGHAVEVRLNAEDPNRLFAAAPGRIRLFRKPGGPGVRVDSDVSQGDVVPAEFDSLVAKVIAWGQDRDQALARLRTALRQTEIVVDGGTTNKALLLWLLDRPELAAGSVDTDWLDGLASRGDHVDLTQVGIALASAAVAFHAADKQAAIALLSRGQSWEGAQQLSRTERRIDLTCDGQALKGYVYELDDSQHRIVPQLGRPLDVTIEKHVDDVLWVTVDRVAYQTHVLVRGQVCQVDVRGAATHRVVRDEGGFVRAETPGVVVSVAVSPGHDVSLEDPIVVLEAMKMETTVTARRVGRVREVLVSRNEQVVAGQALVRIEQPVDDHEHTAPGSQTLGAALSPAQPPRDALTALRSLILGYDELPGEIDGLPTSLRTLHATAPEQGLLERELDCLGAYADLCAVLGRERELWSGMRDTDLGEPHLPRDLLKSLRAVIARYELGSADGSTIAESLYRIAIASGRVRDLGRPIITILSRWSAQSTDTMPRLDDACRGVLDRLVTVADKQNPAVSDYARVVRFQLFEKPALQSAREMLRDHVGAKVKPPSSSADFEVEHAVRVLAQAPDPLLLVAPWLRSPGPLRALSLTVLVRYYYRHFELSGLEATRIEGFDLVTGVCRSSDGSERMVVVVSAQAADLARLGETLEPRLKLAATERDVVLEVLVLDENEVGRLVAALPDRSLSAYPSLVTELNVTGVSSAVAGTCGSLSFHRIHSALPLQRRPVELHPRVAERLEIWRLREFRLTPLPASGGVHLFHAVSHDLFDERLFAFAEVVELSPAWDGSGELLSVPELETALIEAMSAIRRHQVETGRRLTWNRIVLYVGAPWDLPIDSLRRVADRVAASSRGLGLEGVLVRLAVRNDADGERHETVVRLSLSQHSGTMIGRSEVSDHPVRPLSDHRKKTAAMRRRGLHTPYEILNLLTSPGATYSDFPLGKFMEYDLDAHGDLRPVQRPFGLSKSAMVVGVITNFTTKHPEGMERVVILGDPSRNLGALAEPECRRIIAAIELADSRDLPVEWFAVSSGARISMDSGTENMDWTARVLRTIVEVTQRGTEINVIVNGINVGAQSYWNAEATMLMHTRGILVMVGESAMVLTGKQALDFSGGVSAADNAGIGGFVHIMGPNGEAQYWAPNIAAGCALLFRYYEHTYVKPGERFPRRADTSDPSGRNIGDSLHPEFPVGGFRLVGDVFRESTNPGRKKPFDVEAVMRAITDADRPALERWAAMEGAHGAVVWDTHIGGIPLCLIGIQSHDVIRAGPPIDGPGRWFAGTLFPGSSKKLARAISSASGNRPVVVVVNLSGFDGSPESLRKLQLEYGAEIGRSVVNFQGPLIVLVISRYHGGAFVVLSKALNESVEALALEGSYASVIGGVPAAGVVFAADVERRVHEDDGMKDLVLRLRTAAEPERACLQEQLKARESAIRSIVRDEIAREFDRIHTIERALEVGSIDEIVSVEALRPRLIASLERGIEETAHREPELC